ncbi:MAG: DUF302 domain-containing protein [Paracoccaceae bacterium]|nr:DUF302 domain-containing protein [Paracoccaceae bacterium]
MRTVLAGLALAVSAFPALADDIVRVESARDVAATMDALQAAAEGAGATVFARVDHGAGARSVGSDIGDSQLLIFGNPALGTPAIEADRLAGLYLPLKVLVFEDGDGKVWLAYEPPAETLDDLAIESDAEVLAKMAGALQALTAAAAGG